MKPDHQPKIGLDGLVAGRLTFKDGNREIIYDSRGYKFARCPTTGDSRTEPKESARSHCDTGCFFGAYDDGWPRHFAFWEADCFDPPQYLICARSWEDAYDIFLDEFASIPDDDDVESLIDDLLVKLVEREVKEGSIVKFDEFTSEWLKALKTEKPEEYEAFREKAMQELGNDGQVTWAPNGARKHEPDKKWDCLRRAESVNGRELKLVKIELVEES